MRSIKKAITKKQYTQIPQYTTILHPVRIELGLTNPDYIVIDSIDKLSHRRGHPWCSQSKAEIAKFTGISERTVFRSIAKGLEKDLLEQNQRREVRTTEKWIEKVTLYKEKINRLV